MRTLTQLGLGAAALTATMLAGAGCSDNGMSGAPDMAMTMPDLATGGDAGFQIDLAGPLADLKGDPIIRVNGGFAQPFGVIFDPGTNAWYVSNVAGDVANFQNLKDGRGWITKISADYQTVDHNFFTTGLNAPGGMRVMGGKLYVPDVDQLVVVDIAARTAVRSMTVTPAIFLIPYVFMTDVVLDSGGAAYVPEAVGNRILKFATPTTAGASYTSIAPNGVTFPTTVLIDNMTLVVGTTGNPTMSGTTGKLFTMTLAGANVMQLGTLAANFQGIEMLDANNYLVGTTRTHLVDSIAKGTGTALTIRDFAMEGATSLADIGWDPTNKILAVPDIVTNAVYFYKM